MGPVEVSVVFAAASSDRFDLGAAFSAAYGAWQ